MYMESLEATGCCYIYVHHVFGDKQYIGEELAENRMCAQQHKDYTIHQ